MPSHSMLQWDREPCERQCCLIGPPRRRRSAGGGHPRSLTATGIRACFFPSPRGAGGCRVGSPRPTVTRSLVGFCCLGSGHASGQCSDGRRPVIHDHGCSGPPECGGPCGDSGLRPHCSLVRGAGFRMLSYKPDAPFHVCVWRALACVHRQRLLVVYSVVGCRPSHESIRPGAFFSGLRKRSPNRGY